MKILFLAVITIMAGLLGAYAGANGTSKNWRRIGVPLLTVVVGFFVLGIRAIFLMFRSVALSIGYGFPSPDDDEPSALGAFWVKKFPNDKLKANAAIRGTIGLIEALSVMVIPIVTGEWILYILLAPYIVLINVIFGSIVTGEGTFKLLGKELLWEEFLIHGLNTFIVLCIMVL